MGSVAIRNDNDWLRVRLSGIGASEAAAVLGLSPHLSNDQLYRVKIGQATAKDLSGVPCVEYGKSAEKHLRELFALDHPEYKVTYKDYDVIRNPDHPFILATLDGRLQERSGRLGVLEIKTTEIMRGGQWGEWDNQVPDHYYVQLLHQLLATGWDFAVLKAQIKYRKGDETRLTVRHYTLERFLCEDDLEHLLKEEIKFWECVQQRREPSTILPKI